jgi:GT2 family glycosyltransferase
LVAIVSWNSARYLPALFASLPDGLLGAPPWELVVADNNSTDETLSVVSELAPAAAVVRLERNLGYAAGINAAITASAPSEAVLILNPDVCLMPGCAAALFEAARQPGVGIAVPRLQDSAGHLQYSLRREPTVLRALGEALLGGRRAGRFGFLGEVIVDPARYRQTGAVVWATGAVMMISRRCLQEVGRWDESFFLYSEETDYALRARDRGFAVRYVPDAVAVHVGGKGEQSPRLRGILAVNRVRLFARRHGKSHTAVYWTVVMLNETLRVLLGRPENRTAVRALLAPWKRPAAIRG